MSLPYTSATAEADDLGAGRPLPHLDQDRWMRPYGPGPWRVGTAALALMLAAYLLFAALIMVAAQNTRGGALCLAVALLVIMAALRMLRVGLWVSGRGLRQTSFFSTVTVPWRKIAAVRTAQQPVKVLGLPRTVQGQALIITRKSGGSLRPQLTDHNADFLGRVEAFDVAADAIEGWAAELL
ncbi:hypothetical protein [Streptomyces sp. NRRL F-5123]|uniref:hypothetical protein n=1 Tax=Streptomyces sp. NRRL F-5123 TaxID=1463856 RepID=UPI0004E25361|nr:hypothetical protein [Streptomyces sp. NRRL F-5123]